ncbi:hypothetical protein IJG72_06535 [bacterium]|nr:hypothetical protein [bacterium]
MSKIIVRSEAGVFIGEAEKTIYLKELKSGYITLHNSMNINRYEGAASLHQLASGKYSGIRLSPMVETIIVKGSYFEILDVQKGAKIYDAKTNWSF